MKLVLIWFSMVLTSSVFAGESLVFLGERDATKQVFLYDLGSRQLTQVTRDDKWHIYPDITSDGKFIAYVEGDSPTTLQVVTLERATGKKIVWTKPGAFLHPRFSKDGRYLFFSGKFNNQTKSTIAYFEFANSIEKLITRTDRVIETDPALNFIEDDFDLYFPNPSATGDRVLFHRSPPRVNGVCKNSVILYDVAEKKKTQLTKEGECATEPTFSADERLVAYTKKLENNWDVFVLDTVSNQETQITSDAAWDLAPTFLNDGRLVFASNRSGSFELYQMRMGEAESKLAMPLENGFEAYAPRVSGLLEFNQGKRENFLAPARSSFGAAKVGEDLYIVGGHQGHEHTYPESSFLDEVQKYDHSTKQWTKLAPRPVKAHGYQVIADGNDLYAFGGFAYSDQYNPKWKSLAAVHRFDTTTGRWTQLPDMPRPRSSNVAAKVGNKIYLIGGWDSTPRFNNDTEGTFLREIDVFNLETQTFENSNLVIPDPLRRALTAVVWGNEIVLLGGLGQGSSHFELQDRITALNPTTGAWRELQKLPFATFAPAAAVIDNELFIFGGMFKTGEMDYRYVSHIFSLASPDQTSWKHTGRYLYEPKGFSSVINLSNSSVAILGGHNYESAEGDGPVSSFEVFTK